MQDKFNSQQFSTRRLNIDDWEQYKAFCFRFSSDQHIESHTPWQNPDIPQSWIKALTREQGVHFGLFHNDLLVGCSHISFRSNGTAEFSGLMIEPSYRGRGLANHLHTIRRRHLKEIGFSGDIYTEILVGNEPSFKAATRNGFDVIDKRTENGPSWASTYHILQLKRN